MSSLVQHYVRARRPWHLPSLGRPFPVHCSVSCVFVLLDCPGWSSMVLAEKNAHVRAMPRAIA
eukprot:8597847-Pyramimonas_sp.AAC.1